MTKRAYFYIDDVIWCLRDLTKNKPNSIFDNSFFKGLKDAHDKYGLKVQLNLFAQTENFTLADMTDAYKNEFEANSDWLKFSFHAKQETSNPPYLTATLEEIKNDFAFVKDNILRFASIKNFTYGTTIHGNSVSKDGCKGLRESGIKILNASFGECREDKENPELICAYNTITKDDVLETCDLFYSVDTYLYFKKFNSDFVVYKLDLAKAKDLALKLASQNLEYIGYSTQEQYFYPTFADYQSDYMEKICAIANILDSNGYTHFFIEELADEQPIRNIGIQPQLRMFWKNDYTEPVYPTLPEGVEVVSFPNLENALDHWLRIMTYLTGVKIGKPYYDICMDQLNGYDSNYCFFILLNGKPVASSTVVYNYAHQDEGLIHMVACTDEAKGIGIGNLLSKLMLYYLKKGNMKTGMLHTNDFRIPAIKTYLNIGFTPDVSTIDFEQRWEKVLKTIENYKKNK